MTGIFDKGCMYTSKTLLATLSVAISALTFTSCTAVPSSVGSDTPSNQLADMQEPTTADATQTAMAEAPTDTIAATGNALTATTDTIPLRLSSKDTTGLGVTYSTGENAQFLTIDTGNKKSSYVVSKLENPGRLVLDITDSRVKKNTNLTPPNTEVLSQVRLGAHDNKSRVVLDLAQPVKESITQNGSEIVIALRSSGAAANTTIAANTTTAAAAAPVAANDQLADNSAITENTTVTAPQKARATSTETVLSAVNIEAIPGKGNVIIADISNLKDFEFKKTAPSEYVATLHNVTLDPSANQTILAQPRSGQIRSVRPTVKDGDVILRVFAQPDSELMAQAKNNTLVIKASDETADFMAQAKVEPVVPGAADDKKAPAKTEVISDKKTAAAPADEKSTEKSSTPESTVGKSSGNVSTLNADGHYSGRLISLDLQDTDIDNALRIIAEVSNLNIIASSDVQGKVTLRLIDVPWDQALDVILKTNGLDKVQEGNVVRIAPVEKLRLERESLKQAQLAEDELEPLSVKYIRVSYARAEDMKAMIKSVLSERGDVAVDQRTNQLIVKDIKKGLKNAAELISKLDLRTPQVLLETQIIEANRSFLRDLGSQLGFSFIQSPETGNATGYNFPNSVKIGGGLPNSTNVTNFPASISGADGGAAVSMIFGSADGTKSLDANISALEREGRVRIVSRPSVATTNNKAAEITSNETVSVLMPNGGVSTVVGGNGSSGGSQPGTATEKIKAGITLKVTPQASPDYFILMDIQAESSNFGSRVVNGIPSLFERKATSTVLVSSGQTFAIGGIYRTTDRDTIRGVPFLKDIPVLGNLFSGNTVDIADEELLFFITPRIIEGSFDDAAMTASPS